ncbi:MAG TPA: BT_3928 family protein [Cyclobacteriaceae bacterium]
MRNRILDGFSVYFVGGLFIFSGLIKLNDPVGTQIKLEEYFEVFADDFGSFFHIFVPYALAIGMFLIILELALGVGVLLRYRMRTTTTVLLLLMVFFTFLTFYSAYTNKVTDCGCFGDAIKLTPWQSFTKDIILMVFVLHLFWHRRRFAPVLPDKLGSIVIGVVSALCLITGIYALRHLPFIDFRPYRIGNNIPEQMQPQEQPRVEYVFQKDGEEVRSETFLTEADGYVYKSSRVLNEDKIVPKITDYAVTDDNGDDFTPYTFEGAKLLFIVQDVSKASTKNIEAMRSLMEGLEGRVDMMILTSSPSYEIDAFRHEHQLGVPYYFADATVLKTIIRSNPGTTLWVDGTVRGKWHHNDTPDPQSVLELVKP